MKIIVTGGAGYIGSTAAAELIAAGHEVVVIDNLCQGHRAAVPEQATFVEMDLGDRTACAETLSAHKPEAIMHFAAHALVGESCEEPHRYLRNNVGNALNLLFAAVENDVKRFIFSSTANLFDDPKEMPISEKEAIVPGSPYGESKHLIERSLAWLERYAGMKYACLRYFNAAGATKDRGEDHDPETHIIPLILQVALEQRERFSIFGTDYDTPDGTCVRDYIHIQDLVSAHILALDAIGEKSRIYNLGNGQGFSVREVIDTARKITGHEIPAVEAPRRPGDPATLVASSAKIRRELGWEPRYPELTSIVETAWDWHKSHPDGYMD